MTTIRPGRYRHYKGNEYTVIDVALHSETQEEMIVYRQEYGEHGLWVRPKTMFAEMVEFEGRQVPRFRYLGPVESQPIPQNVFANIPSNLPDELIEVLQASGSARIERIVSHGHASPEGFWFDQDADEWVVLLRGAACLRFEAGDAVEMKPGDFMNIPAHKKHRVDWTTPEEPTIWLAVHYGEPQ